MAAKKSRQKTGKPHFRVYGVYRFQDQEPMVRNVLAVGVSPMEVEKADGPRANTVRNLISKKTKRPNHTTLAAILAVAKKKFTIVDA